MTTLAILTSVAPSPQLDLLMFSGFLIAVLTLLIWGYQRQSRSAAFALGICQLAMAIYGFLQGAWPLAMVTIAWSAATFWRLSQGKDIARPVKTTERHRIMGLQNYWENEPGISRIFENN